jgi:hypothetical protein
MLSEETLVKIYPRKPGLDQQAAAILGSNLFAGIPDFL